MLTCLKQKADGTVTVPATAQPLIVMYAHGITMVPSGMTCQDVADEGPKYLNHAVPEVSRYTGIVRDLMLAGF